MHMMEEEKGLTSPYLPTEIWREIGKRLQSRLDVSRFRSVCSTLRSALPTPSRFPLKVPVIPGPNVKLDATCCFITEVTFYAVDHMIVLFEEFRCPKFYGFSFFPKSQNPNNSKLELLASEISNLSFLSNAYDCYIAIPIEKSRPRSYKLYVNGDVVKVAIISSDSDYVNPNYVTREDDLSVVAHLNDGKLAVLRLKGGAMNNEWKTGFCDTSFEDIVNYDGRLYGVDCHGKVFVMDYHSLRMTQVGTGLPLTPFGLGFYWKVLHLAVSVAGHLYLIVYPQSNETYHLVPKIYKLNSRQSTESRIRHLKRWWPLEGDDDQCWVVNFLCNFPVARDLLRSGNDGVMKYKELPRICAYPEFGYARLFVSRGSCDVAA